jgi:hypothetical protein
MKTYSIEIKGIFPLIEREVSRVAAASYSEEGGSLFDVIKITSRDTQIIKELIERRKIQLVKRLRFASAAVTKIEGADEENSGYNFSLSLSDKFSAEEEAKTLILEYLVKGVLLDWCGKKGVTTTEVSAEEVFQIEEDILSFLRTPSYLKAPLQPFGPRKSII